MRRILPKFTTAWIPKCKINYFKSKKKKKGTNKLIYKTEIESQMWKTNLQLPGGKWAGINWETEIDIHTRLYIKQITNKDLLYSTGNSTQYSVMAYMGKESKKEWIYVYG